MYLHLINSILLNLLPVWITNPVLTADAGLVGGLEVIPDLAQLLLQLGLFRSLNGGEDGGADDEVEEVEDGQGEHAHRTATTGRHPEGWRQKYSPPDHSQNPQPSESAAEFSLKLPPQG